VPAESALARLFDPDRIAGPAQAPGAAAQAGSVDDVHRAFSDAVRLALEHGPLVLKLEDIHWVDLGSLRAIDYVLKALSDQPLLVIATARPDVHELYPDLWRSRAFTEIRLGELEQSDAERLVALCLGHLDSAASTRIVERARGNAFLLHELIRAQAEGRSEETPETALGVVQSRLRLFDPEARRVLRAASIFGESFTLEGLGCLTGGESSAMDTEKWLELLLEREVITRRNDLPESRGLFAFAHALVRDAAYDMLTESDRTLGHRLVGEWHESSGHGDPVVTAQHYERGNDSAGAGRCYARATSEAFAIGDLAAAVRTSEAALGCQLEPSERGQVLAIAAEATRLLGDVLGAKRLSSEALRALPPNSPLWRQAARTAMMAGLSGYRYRDS
jgi:predicted ATPase